MTIEEANLMSIALEESCDEAERWRRQAAELRRELWHLRQLLDAEARSLLKKGGQRDSGHVASEALQIRAQL